MKWTLVVKLYSIAAIKQNKELKTTHIYLIYFLNIDSICKIVVHL